MSIRVEPHPEVLRTRTKRHLPSSRNPVPDRQRRLNEDLETWKTEIPRHREPPSPYLGGHHSQRPEHSDYVDPSLVQFDARDTHHSLIEAPGPYWSDNGLLPFGSVHSERSLTLNDKQQYDSHRMDSYQLFPYSYATRTEKPDHHSEGLSSNSKHHCNYPNCGRVVEDLKAHMLTHQADRPEKCPVPDCEYHIKGFARKYDRSRHALTHFKGPIFCGFCPYSSSAQDEGFNRADVYKRHLTSVHGVKQRPQNSKKESEEQEKLSSKDGRTSSCSTCSVIFTHPQDLYDHLDACILSYIDQQGVTSMEETSRQNRQLSEDDSKDSMPTGCSMCSKRFMRRQDLDKHVKWCTLQHQEAQHAGSFETSNPYSQLVEVHWKCKCGQQFEDSVVEFVPGAAILLRPFQSDASNIDLERQEQATEGDAGGTTSISSSQDQLSDISRRRAGKTKEQVPIEPHPNDMDEKLRKRVLLCLPGRGSIELKPSDVTNAITDLCMYKSLNQSLYSAKRRFLSWLTLRRLSNVNFTEFHLYWRTNVAIEANGVGKLPPPEASDYLCSRDTNPPVLLTALQHFIEHPTHAPHGTNYLDRMPKKLGIVPSVAKDGIPVPGYGLHIAETICWTRLLVLEGLLATGALLFAIFWCTRSSGSVGDGFTVAGVILTYGTLLIAAIQGISQRHSVAQRFTVPHT